MKPASSLSLIMTQRGRKIQKQLVQAVRQGRISQAEEIWQSLKWASKVARQKKLSDLWQLASEMPLSGGIKGWLQSKLSFNEALPRLLKPETGKDQEKFDYKSNFFRQVSRHNHDLLVTLSQQADFAYAWEALHGTTGQSHYQRKTEIELWNRLRSKIVKGVQGLTEKQIGGSLILNGITASNGLAANWALGLIDPKSRTTMLAISIHLLNFKKSKGEQEVYQLLLEITDPKWHRYLGEKYFAKNDIDWPEMQKMLSREDNLDIKAIKAKFNREQLRKELPTAKTTAVPKAHL